MQLSKILNRDSNNLDIFRLIAACMVIYAHSFDLAPKAGSTDILSRFLIVNDSGSLAVKVFFFLSGLVVTNSLLGKRNPIPFAIARIFRIWPAMIVVLVISALVIGPATTNLPLADYFASREVYHYIYDTSKLHILVNLPGVFTGNPYKSVVNGALWTIPFEVAAYAGLLGLFLVGIFKIKYLPALLFIWLALDPLFDNKLLITWLPQNHIINLLIPCFAFGAVMATYKEYIRIDIPMLAGAWILFYLFRDASINNFYFFYFSFFSTILYISAQPFMLKLKPKSDISYGMYVWGFPVQQLMESHFSEYGPIFNCISSVLICVALGYLSWHLIEKPAMAFGSSLSKNFFPPLATKQQCSATPDQ